MEESRLLWVHLGHHHEQMASGFGTLALAFASLDFGGVAQTKHLFCVRWVRFALDSENTTEIERRRSEAGLGAEDL